MTGHDPPSAHLRRTWAARLDHHVRRSCEGSTVLAWCQSEVLALDTELRLRTSKRALAGIEFCSLLAVREHGSHAR